MPLFEVDEEELVPFRRMHAGTDLYEQEIEDLLWPNLEAFLGVPAFPVARQPTVADGLRPDIVALDSEGRVQVIEIKRDVDRNQLAQCLEYAGWARGTGLDELAAMFHRGPEAFFAEWTEFTDTDAPRLVQRPPHLILVARDFDARTDAALTFLTENHLPLSVLRVTVYEDSRGRRFVDVDADHEPEFTSPIGGTVRSGGGSPAKFVIDGRRVAVSDLVDHQLLTAGTTLTWHRPRVGENHQAVVLDNGHLRLDDGRTFAAPSIAAREAAGLVAAPGWQAWRLPDGRYLADLREDLLNSLQDADASTSAAAAAPEESVA